MQEYIDQGKTAGIVALVARRGQVAYLKSFGKLDPVKGTPLPVDAIFRIASQTKAVTTVAVMILLEEGRLLLDDPVSKYIPEFAITSVAVQAPEKDAKGYARVPAKRPITIRDLLTHTAGISYGDGSGRERIRGGRGPRLVSGRQADPRSAKSSRRSPRSPSTPSRGRSGSTDSTPTSWDI